MRIVWQDYARIEFKDAVKYYQVHAGNGSLMISRIKRCARQENCLNIPNSGCVFMMKYAVSPFTIILSASFIA